MARRRPVSVKTHKYAPPARRAAPRGRPSARPPRLAPLPGVAGASVSKVLPDTLYVEIREREPVARVHIENSARLIDGAGALLGPAAPDAALPWLETADDGAGEERAALCAYAARMKAE